jgi:hypothetical protein
MTGLRPLAIIPHPLVFAIVDNGTRSLG